MPRTVHGRVHGKTIELDEDLGVPDGQELLVTVEPLTPAGAGHLAPGDGLRQAFGAWAEDAAELDEFLEWNRQQRKVGRGEISE
jgi:hypothetical protein